MNVWQSLTEIPGNEVSVVTIGNFDGMHNGHKKVIATCVERAHKLGVDAVAITFDPHPIQVHKPEVGLQLISPLRDRLDAMEAAGLDSTLVAHYDKSVYSLEPDEFVDEFLVERCGAREVVVGEDFRFGRGNVGTIDTLRALGRRYGFDVLTVTDIEAPEGRRWSSSWVRELLAAGDVSVTCTVSAAPSATASSVVARSDSPPRTSRKRSRASSLQTVSTLAGSCVPSPAPSPLSSCLPPSPWAPTHSSTARSAPSRHTS